MSAPIGAECDDSSSDTENEEEMERLREATYVGVSSPSIRLTAKCIAKNETCGKSETKKLVGNKPSLRYPQNSQDDSFNSNLHVTAEVKAFIAKKLSQSLDLSIELSRDSELSEAYKKEHQCEESSNDDFGFRMFSNKTQEQLEAKGKAKRLKLQQASRMQKQKNSSSDSSEEDARLAEAAVSPEFILRNSSLVSMQTEQGSKSKANMADTDNCSVIGSERAEDSMDSDQRQSTTDKKKFKKKKRQKTELAKDSSEEETETRETFREAANGVKKKKRKKCKHSHADS
ncbi:nucleolar protein 58-like [Liolophura sinensis]|uniref:nucleolar protein 58-like n=1 Tax=Liolophura sinensis TaxID=3198878 RepID=UPI0031590DCF